VNKIFFYVSGIVLENYGLIDVPHFCMVCVLCSCFSGGYKEASYGTSPFTVFWESYQKGKDTCH